MELMQSPPFSIAARAGDVANKPTFGLGIKAEDKKCGKPGFLFWDYCRMQTSLWIRHSVFRLYATDYTTLR